MPRHLRLLSLFLLLCCPPLLAEEPASDAAGDEPPAEQVPQRPALPERSEQTATALEQRLDTREQQRLTTASEQFLALWLPANAADPRGLVLILPGDNLSPEAPDVMAPLRHKLPDAGWHSLSIVLPDPLSRLPLRQPLPATEEQPAEAAEDPAPSQPGEETPAASDEVDPVAEQDLDTRREEAEKAHVERVFARIDAALAFAAQHQPSRVVVLGQGSGAYWGARYIKEKTPTTTIGGLLLISPQLPEGFAPGLDELAPTLTLPVGDLFYKDQATERQAALRRLQASKRLKAPHYQQVALRALPGNRDTEQEQLFRRARGWLDKLEPR